MNVNNICCNLTHTNINDVQRYSGNFFIFTGHPECHLNKKRISHGSLKNCFVKLTIVVQKCCHVEEWKCLPSESPSMPWMRQIEILHYAFITSCKIDILRNCISPLPGSLIWNNLPSYIKSSRSDCEFTNNMKNFKYIDCGCLYDSVTVCIHFCCYYYYYYSYYYYYYCLRY